MSGATQIDCVIDRAHTALTDHIGEQKVSQAAGQLRKADRLRRIALCNRRVVLILVVGFFADAAQSIKLFFHDLHHAAHAFFLVRAQVEIRIVVGRLGVEPQAQRELEHHELDQEFAVLLQLWKAMQKEHDARFDALVIIQIQPVGRHQHVGRLVGILELNS